VCAGMKWHINIPAQPMVGREGGTHKQV
jgi:hypothetical protein